MTDPKPRYTDDPFTPKILDATAMGWTRRGDLGPDVWESPNGMLWRCNREEEPLFVRAPELKP